MKGKIKHTNLKISPKFLKKLPLRHKTFSGKHFQFLTKF